MSWGNSGSLRSRSPGAPTVTTQSKEFLHTLCRGGRLAGVGRDGPVTKADLDAGLAAVRAGFRGDPYRALWIRTGAIAGTIVAAAGFAVAVELL